MLNIGTAHSEFIEYYTYTVDEAGDTSVVVSASFDTAAMQLRGEIHRSPLGTALEIADLTDHGGGFMSGNVVVSVADTNGHYITLTSHFQLWPVYGVTHTDTIDMDLDIPTGLAATGDAAARLDGFINADVTIETSTDLETGAQTSSFDAKAETELADTKLRIDVTTTKTDGDVSTEVSVGVEGEIDLGGFDLFGCLEGSVDEEGNGSFEGRGELEIHDALVRVYVVGVWRDGLISGRVGVGGEYEADDDVIFTWSIGRGFGTGLDDCSLDIGLWYIYKRLVHFGLFYSNGEVFGRQRGSLSVRGLPYRTSPVDESAAAVSGITPYWTLLSADCQSTYCCPDSSACVDQVPLTDQMLLWRYRSVGIAYQCTFDASDPNSVSESLSVFCHEVPRRRDHRQFYDYPRVNEFDFHGPEDSAGRYLATVPNPFNADARIVFEHALDEHVEVDIYDVSGRRVRSLASKEFPAGRNDVTWDGRNDRGVPVAGGMYFVVITGGQWRATGRAVLVK